MDINVDVIYDIPSAPLKILYNSTTGCDICVSSLSNDTILCWGSGSSDDNVKLIMKTNRLKSTAEGGEIRRLIMNDKQTSTENHVNILL